MIAPVIFTQKLKHVHFVNGLSGYVRDIDDDGPLVEFPTLGLTTRIQKVQFTGKLSMTVLTLSPVSN